MFPYFRICRSEEEVLAAIDEIEVGRKTLDVLTDGAVIKVNDAARARGDGIYGQISALGDGVQV